VKKCIPNCSSATTITRYIFSGSQVIAEYDNGAAASAPSREYLYAGGLRVATLVSTTPTYHLRDHLSVRVNTDSSGNIIGEQGHFPFGDAWYMNSTTTKWIFTTYERDPETGNDYAMARYYANRLGRFSSIDPLSGSLGSPQSLNHYSYALNDPINLADPTGMSSAQEACDPSHDQTCGGDSWVLYGGAGGAGVNFGSDGRYLWLFDPWDSDYPRLNFIQPAPPPTGEDPSDDCDKPGDPTFLACTPPQVATPVMMFSNGGANLNVDGGGGVGSVSCRQIAAGKVPSAASGSWWTGVKWASVMLNMWAGGQGPTQITFGPNTVQSRQMMTAYGMAKNVSAFLAGGPSHGFQNFGALGLLSSGINPTAQFVGGYGWNMWFSGGNLNISLSNSTTMFSAFFDSSLFNPNPPTRSGSTPMGRVNQTFNISVPCR
jgi:RHS repeat-associated protein